MYCVSTTCKTARFTSENGTKWPGKHGLTDGRKDRKRLAKLMFFTTFVMHLPAKTPHIHYETEGLQHINPLADIQQCVH